MTIDTLEADAVECGAGTGDETPAAADPGTAVPATTRRAGSVLRRGLILGLAMAFALCGLTGWLGWRSYQAHRDQAERELFLQVGRQAAVNLTTISYAEAEADVQRILDSSTGRFHEDFSKRSRPFIDAVKQAQSRSVGTVTLAGLESVRADRAQVLVAVAVKSSTVDGDQQPRSWRMRITVQKVDAGAKVANVEFV